MDQAGIIRDLLIWLEGHLDQPLSLDNVAAKAGYSKWHLQRMFKDVTGHAIGAYIRARRLSKSAVALRLTTPDCASDSGHRAAIPLRLSTDIYPRIQEAVCPDSCTLPPFS